MLFFDKYLAKFDEMDLEYLRNWLGLRWWQSVYWENVTDFGCKYADYGLIQRSANYHGYIQIAIIITNNFNIS